MNIIAERLEKEERIYELINDNTILGDLIIYIPKLMNCMWEQPEIVSLVIKKTDINELKKHIAPYFANNFYSNILSPYYIEDNLMYVLTLLLQDEINNLKETNQEENFLNNTPCGYLLEELKRKSDIQTFFKTIIFNAVEDLELNHSSSKINFEILKFIEDYKRQNKNSIKGNEDYMKIISLNNSSMDLEDYTDKKNKKNAQSERDEFNEKYMTILDKSSLEEYSKDYQNNRRIYDYFNSKLNDTKNNDNYYSNKHFFYNLEKCDFSEKILIQYQKSFLEVISFINSIIDKILKNFHLLPYSVKCLCKIISILVSKKFPSICEHEKNSFIAKFFFGKLLTPFLMNPGIEAFINNIILSKNAINNLRVICNIINKMFSGKFYISSKNNEYTPFNFYFKSKVNEIFNIFDHLTNVRLPSFIDKFINNELPPNYKYNYFKENPDEVICHRSTCFNLEQINSILHTMDRYKKEIFFDEEKNEKKSELKKTMEILVNKHNQKIFERIISMEHNKNTSERKNSKKKIKEEIIIKKRKVQYFLITELLTNENYTKLFKIEQTSPNFSIKELKTTPNEEDITQNNIIRVKNFFCSLLYNYFKLNKTDFDEGTIGNTIDILKQFNIFMKSSNFVVDGTIPSEWYISSLFDYLKRIPENLTKNDFENLYNEIENDVNKSIKELDFEALSVIMGKLKFSEKKNKYFKNVCELLKDIKLNEETKEIIVNEFIPVDIKFSLNQNVLKVLEEEYKENKKIIKEKITENFDVNPSNFKEKDKNEKQKIKDYEKKNKIRLCINIEDFTKKFPNIAKYQEYQDVNVFLIQKLLDFPQKLNKYFEIIQNKIKEKKRNKNEDNEKINEKIYDYVMSKIYDKIYPKECSERDMKIFQSGIKLSWTEPKHFIKSKRELVFGSFLNDVDNLFKLMDLEKSPRKKLLNVSKIFESITFLLQFNGKEGNLGLDVLFPIINYSIVKSPQFRLYSNIKFIKLYIGKKNEREKNQIVKINLAQTAQLCLACKFIEKIKYTDLNDINYNDFEIKCKEAINRDYTSINKSNDCY